MIAHLKQKKSISKEDRDKHMTLFLDSSEINYSFL
jgi:hypothetical protein